jgi:phytoene desaturase
MQKESQKAIIIGAGIAGIALAVRLACKGHLVEVYEANAYPGGKLSALQLGDYRFDAGPSLFTLPEEVDKLFRLAGEEPSAHFRYHKLPVSCKYFYEDQTIVNAYANPEDFAEELHRKLGVERKRVLAAYQNSKSLYSLLRKLFMERSLHSWKTWLNPAAFRAYGQLPRMDFFRSMHKANSHMLKNEKATQLFNRYATYNGSNPYQAPATLNIIPYLEMGIGAFFPEGGMHSITKSLYALAQRLGVELHLSSPVEKIQLDGRKAKGIIVNGRLHTADMVISNADMLSTYRKLLPQFPAPRRLLEQPKSSSALIFYWGIKHSFPQLDLHNIFFSKHYQREFKHIFQLGSIDQDPSVYINITAKQHKIDAPPGCENWFTMINVPNNSGQDWDSLIKEARGNILKKLSRILNTDIEKHIEYEQVMDPRLIEAKTSSAMGALYGNSSNSKYAAFLRHANKSRRIRNLYFCGGSVHPGGGIPLCLLSAKIAADLIDQG